jgi:putative CocE/NonD family hydrolase
VLLTLQIDRNSGSDSPRYVAKFIGVCKWEERMSDFSSRKIAKGIVLERDVAVRMHDGVQLMANVFRSESAGRRPVVLSVTPYGKDKLPDWLGMTFMRIAGARFGKLNCSRWTGFEAPDPIFWVQAGYAVVQADVRGMHRSQGRAGVLTREDAKDYVELIEWSARQSWSTGSVGLCGVSYLAMSQWRVAALQPPSLKAIIPWEGVTDLLRELGYQDGIPETYFTKVWWKVRMKRGRNRRFPMAEDFLKERDARPLDDDWWESKRPNLEAITVPALVCASWSDHGLHTRGSLIGFERLGSPQKWLYTHGRRKWETFYSEEARDVQRRFFDHFLKGQSNGWNSTACVRLETRKSRDEYSVRPESSWPLTTVRYTQLFLDARTRALGASTVQQVGQVHYRGNGRKVTDQASFEFRFAEETELTGTMALKLWVSTSEGQDLDLFAVIRKFDLHGNEVHFFGYNGYAKDSVAKGWLRASHRALDPTLSRVGRPWHAHKRIDPLKPDDVVPVEIEILASSTIFEAGSILRLDIAGRDFAKYPAFRHARTVNRGIHTIHTGAHFDSHLVTPLVGRDPSAVDH